MRTINLARIFSIFGLVAASLGLQSVQADEVNIYSYRQPELIQPLLDEFTYRTGIETNVIFLQKGMIARLEAEGTRSPADVLLTVDISRLQNLVNAGVTQVVDSDILNQNIPANFRDPEGEWYALTLRARIVYASKERVSEQALTYEELVNPEWKGRICTRSGTNAYNLALISSVMNHHGMDQTKAWLQGIKNNLARKPQGNDRAQVKAIWAGECDISLGNTYYMGLMLSNEEQKAWADAVRIIFPTFVDGGTHVNVSGMAMAKHSPNESNALQLMEFLSSMDAQQIYAEVNHEYPVRPYVALSELVESWGTFEPDNLNLDTIGANREQALQIVNEIDFDG
ncbi:MAG: Fe(3+) ABC transporter substrate-binding protein [Rhodobacteraceae bacterium]|nr:Fe(3+) ABC transporter substrate-binding protein [Paracoccaceae bacterium]